MKSSRHVTTAPLKPLAHLFDDEFTLSPDELSLALWMKKRYFCTLFEAACAFFPPGVWNKGQEVYVPGPLPLDEALAKAGGGQKARLTEACLPKPKAVWRGRAGAADGNCICTAAFVAARPIGCAGDARGLSAQGRG